MTEEETFFCPNCGRPFEPDQVEGLKLGEQIHCGNCKNWVQMEPTPEENPPKRFDLQKLGENLKENYKKYLITIVIIVIGIMALIPFYSTNQIISIGNLIVDGAILIKSIQVYYNYRIPTMRYFLSAFILFFLADVLRFIIFFIGNILFSIQVLLFSINIFGNLFGYFTILIFFDMFRNKASLNRGNIILLTILTIWSTALLIITGAIIIFQNELFSSVHYYWTIDITSLSAPGQALILLYDGFLIGCWGLVILQLLLLIGKINKRLKISSNPQIKKTLRKMQIGAILICIGGFLEIQSQDPWIGNIFELLGLILFFYIYLKEGIYVLQEETLRRIIIIDYGGIPVYSYLFKHYSKIVQNPSFEEKKRRLISISDSADDILFSGTLKAILNLLGEFTGSNQILREISLDKSILLIKQTPDKRYTVVLLSDSTSSFIQDALDRFTASFFKELPHLPSVQALSRIELNTANHLSEMYFGPGLK